ncbi:MAG: hypothetical protein R3F56_23365 [Planctomycetota bacterium]
MRPTHLCRVLLTLVSVSVGSAVAAVAQGTPIGFVEDFALAEDRAKALEQLIPGTAEHSFYQCLVLQQQGRFDEVTPVLRTWIEQHGRSALTTEIEHRQALLTYERDPQATLTHLQRYLGLRFDHQRQTAGTPPDLPTRLDPALVSEATLTRRALDTHLRSVDGFTDAALESLVGADLDADRLMSLLARLRRPDVPNLPALVVRNLGDRRSRGFGSLRIHKLLLLDQLDACARQRPDLLNDGEFLGQYIRRLRPSADVSWQNDWAARLAYLERLQAFVDRLSPAQNSLRAHVAYHRLRHDLAAGTLDRDRLLAYLRLPRNAAYISQRWLERSADPRADLGSKFATGLDPVRRDEPVVRAYLAHFLRDADGPAGFADFVDGDYLRRLFAETKILAGIGDMQRWYALLNDPAYYERLKERVDLDFAPTQPTYYAAEDAVALEVDVKNVKTLLLRVFEIDTVNYYRETGKEVDAAIDLDGLVANVEQTLTYGEGPLLRVRRRFELPSLGAPGVYVVELIGNGTSSRAVIHKGRLQYTQRLGAAGHVLRVLDERGQHLRTAHAWFGGRDYAADADGEVVIPFSTKPGLAPLVLQHGNLATLSSLDHRAERYELTAGVHIDREGLLARRTARLAVRPRLALDDEPVGLQLLQQPSLVVTAIDIHGVASVREVRDIELSAEQEFVHEFRVPDDLSRVSVVLRGKVRDLSNAKDVDLATAERSFTVNQIDATDQTACPVLSRSAAGYALDLRGKEGEPLADRAVHLVLQHRLFTDPVHVDLKTDAQGRIALGAMPGIERLQASGFPADVGAFQLRGHGRSYPTRVHGAVGQTLRVPLQSGATELSRAVASLLEVRGGAFVRDAFEHLALAGGFVELRDLEPGDYDLWLEEPDVHVEVRVTQGQARDGWAVGRDRLLQLDPPRLQVVAAELAGDELRVRLANAGARTRVHVLVDRFVPAFDPWAHLSVDGRPAPAVVGVEHGEVNYEAGREIGEEYRYVLERRFATRFPGNMLRRPSLLLNPWALQETETMVGAGGGAGGKFGGRGGRAAGGPSSPGPSPSPAMPTRPPGTFANLDFLPATAAVVLNLRPDADGVVRVPRDRLGDGQLVQVLAVDGDDTVYTTLAADEKPLAPRARRLPTAIAAARHVVEQRRIEFLPAGASARLIGESDAQVQTYDSLASVFQLLATLNPGAELSRFAFLLGWPELTVEAKRDLYSRHACHELHFFLQQKDPEFFAQEVRPFLACKMHKTFLDDWLLEVDMQSYLEPRAFARLNVVERILLARRLGRVEPAVQRLLRDAYDLLPPDLERVAHLFDTTLRGTFFDEGAAGDVRARTENFFARRKVPGRPADKQDAAKLARAQDDEEPAAEAAPVEKARADGGEDDFMLGAQRGRAELKEELKDVALRERQQRLYRAPDPTLRYVEHNYWHRRIEEQGADLVTVNAFWRDYALADRRKPFVSDHIAEASGSFAEMMLALAVLDLPFKAAAHATSVDGNDLRIEAGSPLLLVRKELVDTEPAADSDAVLVNENFFRLDARYSFVGNERRDAWIDGEFQAGVPYGCQVVVTNPTSTPRQLEVLLQVPEGAIPVRSGYFTRGFTVALDAYATAALEYAFYFPVAGRQPHYPVHVAERGKLVAFAAPRTLEVVVELSKVDTTSWDYVSQNGSVDEVLAFVEENNLLRLDLGMVAWRMRDQAFFVAMLERLRQRLVYDGTLWSYGVLHRDERAMREYLCQQDGFVQQCGHALRSALLEIDPVERRAYQHVEYEPLFNSRAHRFGRDRVILNASLARQYADLLAILAERTTLDAEDWLSVTYYLLLQDRVEEALRGFARIDPAALPTRVQYDYLRAYLDFYSADHALARGIAESYRTYPIPHWRTRFLEVLQQLDEADGKTRAAQPGAGEDVATQQGILAAAQPMLDLVVEARRVTLRYRGIDSCEVRYYRTDVEFLFSTHPFVQQGSEAFTYIRPNRADVRTLPADANEVSFDLPAEFLTANVLVEVRGGGVTRRQSYYANTLAAQFIDTYGQVMVTDASSGKPLPRVYVKVFARTEAGRVRFFKDGYTDLRGRFDYASVSGDAADDVERFAVLVLSDDRGATMREVDPPKR